MKNTSEKNVTNVSQMLEKLNQSFVDFSKEADKVLHPVRQNAFTRFPTLFLLLVAFCVTMIQFSFERLLAKCKLLYDRLLLLMVIGILVLVGTGKLYKKLS